VDYQPIEPQEFEDEDEGIDEEDESNLSGSEY
jgi:hypothetical protein